MALGYAVRWYLLERGKTDNLEDRKPNATDFLIGFIVNFFDTLGIGSFAPATAWFKLTRRMNDEKIPGTLNSGNALPTMTQALIYLSVVPVDFLTLASMLIAAVLGAVLGVGVVSRLSRRAIQFGMGAALLCAALLFTASNLKWIPGGGDATGLYGAVLVFAVVMNFFFGALMMLGIGLYAPCLILVSLLGMSPRAAFPIMSGSCGLLMPVGGVRFIKARRYHLGASLGLAIGGIPGVAIAAYFVKQMDVFWLRWLVVVVVLYAALQMLLSAIKNKANA
jgi:uncharacterized membrane protein YfcA